MGSGVAYFVMGPGEDEWIADAKTEAIADRIIADHAAARNARALEERVRQLEAGLEKYGMHMSRCDWHRSEVCDCGFAALLASPVATDSTYAP
jgi:hypothetical protein